MQYDGMLLLYIPQEQITYLQCELVIQNCGEFIKYVPEHMQCIYLYKQEIM
jgi:hypothetical protein